MRISRTDRSKLAEWWFTVDHALIAAVLALVAAGLVLSLAASPAVALKKGLATYHFVGRHVAFSLVGVALMLAVSLMEPRTVRRLALVLLAAGLAGLVLVHLTGREINGARRWLDIAGHSLQPSEFVKPAFVVVAAWLFAEARSRPDMPALALAVLMLASTGALLVIQPDVGQTLLVTAAWGALYFLSGQPLAGAAVLAALGVAGAAAAYATFPHVAARVDRFLAPGSGENGQIERAMRSFSEGGFLGRGPGEGTIKSVLPDAHTDFIFAVVAEEYGVLACLVIVGLFAFVVLRALHVAAQHGDPRTRLAIQGLALLFGLQALINMGVNVGLMPAKGMTLPFISAGGSSTLAVSLTLGMLFALARIRPGTERYKKPRLAVTIDEIELEGKKTR
jgi:cell division protein FtsW